MTTGYTETKKLKLKSPLAKWGQGLNVFEKIIHSHSGIFNEVYYGAV